MPKSAEFGFLDYVLAIAYLLQFAMIYISVFSGTLGGLVHKSKISQVLIRQGILCPIFMPLKSTQQERKGAGRLFQ